jgi:uncharacterized membrane protein
VDDDPVDPIAEPAKPIVPPTGPAPGAGAGRAWSFGDHQMRSPEFNTAMVHFYRAEVQRSNTWRTRLDTTTNWAVITTGAGLSFALSDPTHHYTVILLNILLVTLFLWIEARRYRYYELWSYRVRLMEIDYFAAMLVPPFAPRADWAENLSRSLLAPRFPVSMLEAVGRRCRRNYIWMFVVLDVALAMKWLIYPTSAGSWPEFVGRAKLGPVPGGVMLAGVALYTAALLAIAFGTAGLRGARGEVLPEFAGSRLISRLWNR